MQTKLTLHQQRKRLNHIFDSIISHPNLSETKFDKAMQEWVVANKKLEAKEECLECTQNKTDFTSNGNLSQSITSLFC